MAKRELLENLGVTNAGRGELIPPSGGGLNEGWKPILRVSGDSERAKSATVTVTPDFPPAFPPGQNPRLIGRVRWGQEGAQALAFFDVGPEGTVLQVNGSFVEVDVKNAETPGAGFVNVPVSGFVAYEPRPAAPFSAPKRTVQGTVPPAGNVVTDIPPFASYLTTFPADLAGGPFLGTFLDSANTNIGQFPIPGSGGFFEIPGGARRVQIDNAGGVAEGMTIVFGIRL